MDGRCRSSRYQSTNPLQLADFAFTLKSDILIEERTENFAFAISLLIRQEFRFVKRSAGLRFALSWTSKTT